MTSANESANESVNESVKMTSHGCNKMHIRVFAMVQTVLCGDHAERSVRLPPDRDKVIHHKYATSAMILSTITG